jgi:hypothetical protein
MALLVNMVKLLEMSYRTMVIQLLFVSEDIDLSRKITGLNYSFIALFCVTCKYYRQYVMWFIMEMIKMLGNSA